MGKGDHLGELEELVLMIVASHQGTAYGVSVKEELKRSVDRSMNVSAIHSVLKRLEVKGYVISHVGGATQERGGRRKRIFEITTSGKEAIQQSMEEKMALYYRIPGIATNQ